ncbi:MAG TPA: glycoside hydrolase family 38 C-terminal domain-containing protein [Fimbriimonas sp.]
MKPIVADRIQRKIVKNPGKDLSKLLRRVSCELDFARALGEATDHPEWASLLDQAEARLDTFDGGLEALQAEVGKIEDSLAPVAAVAKEYVIHCVGHGHIDMNWMWSWPETVAATHDTFASALSFMEQYPDFTYSQSQASVYEIVERHYPAMFEEIKRRVKEGRWEVTAAHWVEGDKNLASGESLAHHLLYTRHYFQEKFGLSPEDVPVDWEPDTFGHANTIPTILKQGGLKYYYSCRTGGGYHHDRVGDVRPPVFWWRGPDGSKILVNRETTWYNSYVNIGTNYAAPLVVFAKATGLRNWLNVYGIGNHGGGPTREEIDYFIESQSWPIWPTVRFSTSKAYFEAIEQEIETGGLDIPVIDHELNFEFTGCYTTQTSIKRANRFGENYCVETEGLTVLGARSLGLDASQLSLPDLRKAWLNVLFNQFHDILPGSGVAATREHAMGLFQETGAITGSIKRNVTKEIARRIDTLSLLPDTPEGREERALVEKGVANTPFEAGAGLGAGQTGYSQSSGGGRRFFPFVVYNPCAWERSEIVQAHLYDIDLDPSRIVAIDANGRAVPTMLVYKSGNSWADWGHTKYSLLFPAENVPSLGYKTFILCEGTADDVPAATLLGDGEIRTPHLAVNFDRYHSGFNVTSDPEGHLGQLGVWQFVTERPRGMTAWVLGGEIEPPQPLVSQGFSVHGAQRNEGTGLPSGSSFAYIVTNRMVVPGTSSTVTVRALVHALEPRVDFEADVDWREIGDEARGIPGLLLDFAVNTFGHSAVYETPYGSIHRTMNGGEEVPTLRYAHLPENGLTILQDCKYGHARCEDGLQMRIVRSSFDPDHAPEVGKSKVRYSVYFHDAEAKSADLTRLGAAWNHPLIVFPATLQSGGLPTSQSYASVEGEGIVLAGLKLAEDGGLVLRLVNYGDADARATVLLDEPLVQGLATAETVDLMERPVTGDATLEGSRVSVSVPARSFSTVRLRER